MSNNKENANGMDSKTETGTGVISEQDLPQDENLANEPAINGRKEDKSKYIL